MRFIWLLVSGSRIDCAINGHMRANETSERNEAPEYDGLKGYFTVCIALSWQQKKTSQNRARKKLNWSNNNSNEKPRATFFHISQPNRLVCWMMIDIVYVRRTNNRGKRERWAIEQHALQYVCFFLEQKKSDKMKYRNEQEKKKLYTQNTNEWKKRAANNHILYVHHFLCTRISHNRLPASIISHYLFFLCHLNAVCVLQHCSYLEIRTRFVSRSHSTHHHLTLYKRIVMGAGDLNRIHFSMSYFFLSFQRFFDLEIRFWIHFLILVFFRCVSFLFWWELEWTRWKLHTTEWLIEKRRT